MARARNIKYGFFQNEDLPEIEPLGRLLFIGLWCLADRAGRLEDRPKRIKMQLFPAENCDTDRYLSDLARHGFITRYEVEGQRYLQINHFSKHQTPHKTEKESVIPPLPAKEAIQATTPENHFSLENKEEAETITENVDALTVKAPLINGSTTVIAPLSNGGLTVALPPDSLIPDSRILIPGSGILNPECGNKKTLSPASTRTVVKNLPDAKSIESIFEYWKAVMHHPNAQLDASRKKIIRNALQMGYGIEELGKAVEGCSYTPHNMGQNDRGQRYDGLHVILRDADQIDRFIRNSHEPPKIKSKADQLTESNISAAMEWAHEKLNGKSYAH